MAATPSLGVPELAGIASYKEATRIGYSVDENVRRLLRYHWVEKRLAQILIARIPETAEWEVKGGFSLHQWLDIEHATVVADRIREMRHPVPRLDLPPDEKLERFLQEVEQAQDTVELLAGVYRVARADLVDGLPDAHRQQQPAGRLSHPTRPAPVSAGGRRSAGLGRPVAGCTDRPQRRDGSASARMGAAPARVPG